MISILMPTRGRFDSFLKSINSLYDNSSDVNNFEVLIAMDNDDIENIEKVHRILKPNMKLFIYERQFYKGLQNYYNDLSNKSVGDSLFLWNDDALMNSKNWDLEIINNHKNGFCVLNPMVDTMMDVWDKEGWVLFPIIPRKWLEITGCWSLVPACDSWVGSIAARLGVVKNIPNVVVTHDRYDLTENNLDQTYYDARNDRSNPENNFVFHIGYPEVMEEHYQKLNNYIINNK